MKRSVSLQKSKVKGVKTLNMPQAAMLLRWYDQYRRILPWRALPGVIPDPYPVWLSEIMLQQTTVAAVGPYYQKFLKRWPTIHHLAKAPLNQVLQMWAGLGYYRRAHSLHECAKHICANWNGRFPETYESLLLLPGFGPYTAAAVGAIAFNQRTNVVDGNVERVMARIFAVRTPLPQAKLKLRDLAAGLLPKARYGDYAQALMDLGATICTPRNPKCDLCPWNKSCQARALGIQEKLPRREKAKARPIRQTLAFIVVNRKNEILLRQRPKTGLLGGMMEVPSSEWREELISAKTQKDAPVKARWKVLPGHVQHVFTHFELNISVAIAATTKPVKGKWVALHRLDKEALPSVMRKIIRHALSYI
ncbi:MAG: A/G-specific adenine glycosylase [Alphaproteobacteria bacterium]